MKWDEFISIVNSASALSLVADLDSAERTPDGQHVVAPPTYANAVSNGTGYLLVGLDSNGQADNVRLDSPQSMAHRLTEILARRGITSNIVLLKPDGTPLLTKEGGAVHSSMLSHRASDAILQDSRIDGLPFRQSAIGKAVLAAHPHAAGPWWQYFPEVLLFGFWDSFAKIRSGVPHGAKVARSLLAEIYGYHVRLIPGGATKIDLLGINNSAGRFHLDAHHQASIAAAEHAEAAKVGATKGGSTEHKGQKPSELGHGGVVQKDPATARRGDTPARPRGVAVQEICLQAFISLNYLQGFRFGESDELNGVVRASIAAAGLGALYSQLETGVFLRSGAQLNARSAVLKVERGLKEPEVIARGSKDWFDLYEQGAAHAARLGLPRVTNEIKAIVTDAVVKAIADSMPEGEAGPDGND